MRMRARLRIVLVAMFVLALGAVGGASDALAQDAPQTCERMTAAADNHTCQHGDIGPFASVGSAPYPGDAPTTNVSTTHVLYTVALSGESGDNQSAVLFQPSNSGTYAFYMNEAYPLELLDSEGQVVSLRLENDVLACPQHLGWFRVYEDLEAGQTYTLVVGPSEKAFVQVVVEVLAVFWAPLYVDADGDSYGALDQAMRTWCGVAAGYSSVPGDCNDDETDTFPGAEETCNGVDDDCDGEVDETEDALCPADASCMGDEGCIGSSAEDCETEGCDDSPQEDDSDHDVCNEKDCGAASDAEDQSAGDDVDASGNSGVGFGSSSGLIDSPKDGSAGAALAGQGGEGSGAQVDSDGPPTSGNVSGAGCSCRQAPLGGTGTVWNACLVLLMAGLWRRLAPLARVGPQPFQHL